MATTHTSLFDTFFLALALIALAVLLSILAVAIIGGLMGGAVGGTLGTPGLIISMGALVLLLAALTALVLDQTSH
jgi:hypothetical protein